MRIPRGLGSQPLVVAIVGGVAATVLGSLAVVALTGSNEKSASEKKISDSRSAVTVGSESGRTTTTREGSRRQSIDEGPASAAVKTAEARFLEDVSVAGGDDPDKGDATIGGETFEHSLRYVVTGSISGRERSTEYNLAGRYENLKATLGLEEGSDAGVRYSVFVDGRRVLDRVVNVGQTAPINVDVAGGSRLRLTVAPSSASALAISGKATAVWGSAKLS